MPFVGLRALLSLSELPLGLSSSSFFGVFAVFLVPGSMALCRIALLTPFLVSRFELSLVELELSF